MKIPSLFRFRSPSVLQQSSIVILFGIFGLIGNLSVKAQGPYYPVNPAGGTYGGTYTGTPVLPSSPATSPYLSYVEAYLAPGLTIRKPVPTGLTTADGPQIATAVKKVALDILSGALPSVPTTIFGDTSGKAAALGILARELVEYRSADSITSVAGITQAIVTAPSTDLLRLSSLKAVIASLAKTSSIQIQSVAPTIFQQAGTLASTAKKMGEIAAAGIAEILKDDGAVKGVVKSAGEQLALSVLPTSGVDAKATVFLDTFIPTVLASVPSTNAVLIEGVATGVFNNLSLAGLGVPGSTTLSNLNAVIDKSVQVLNTSGPTKSNVGALLTVALRQYGSANATAIKNQFAASSNTVAIDDYTKYMVEAYQVSSTDALFLTYIQPVAGDDRKANADGAAAGAIVAGANGAKVVEYALKYGTASVINVLQSAVAADLNGANDSPATALGAINPATFLPWAGNFTAVAEGAVLGARDAAARGIVKTLVSKTFSSAPVNNNAAIPGESINRIIDGAIRGAYDSNKSGTVAGIVYDAMFYVQKATGASVNGAYFGATGDGVLKDFVKQAITTAGQEDPGNGFIAGIAALTGDSYGSRRAEIQAAGDTVLGAAFAPWVRGKSVVQKLQTTGGGAAKAFGTVLAEFTLAGSDAPSILAVLYGSNLVNSKDYFSSNLATAIKLSAAVTTSADALALANASYNSTSSGPGATRSNVDLIVDVAVQAKANQGDILDYVGRKVTTNSGLVREIASAWTTVDPNHAHFVAHAVGFNSSTNVGTTVTEIFRVAQITSVAPATLPTYASTPIKDKPAAAAAITAGVVTGILETNAAGNGGRDGTRTDAQTRTALVSAVSAAVAASATQDGVALASTTNGVTANSTFRQNTGIGVSTLTQSIGVAGAVTGAFAQVTQLNDHLNAQILNTTQIAVINAAAVNGGTANGRAIAQAAAQTFRWVTSVAAGVVLTPAQLTALQTAIWSAFTGTYAGNSATEPGIKDAVAFGVAQADAGILSAGALGLNNTNGTLPGGNLNASIAPGDRAKYYVHKSATGAPVTDIFNL